MTGRRDARVRLTAVLWVAVVVVFLATRLVFLDRDLPPWELAQYQPIDEFAYTLPSFNLHHYGTWAHQEVPWVPVEGSPMNVLQSIVTAMTLSLGWTYWGFRLSSVLFALVAVLAMLAVARNLVAKARTDGSPGPFPPIAILAVTTVLLLVDFGFLVSGRVVEATTARVAVVAVLLWLIARGTLLGERHGGRRSFTLGLLAGLAVGFGYVYNAFLVPGAILLVAWWDWQRGGPRRSLRGAALTASGSGVALALYFALVYLVYGDTPVDWYWRWLSTFREAGRADALDLGQVWGFILGNSFRLDRPLMAVTLIALPIFAWWAVRRRDRLGMAVLAIGLALVAQTAFQSDYPQRKMLILLPLIVPIAVGGLLRVSEWHAVLARSRHRRLLGGAWAAWIVVVVAASVALALPPGTFSWDILHVLPGLPATRNFSYRGPGGDAVLVGAIVGAVALLVMLARWSRPRVAAAAGAVVLGAMLGPLVLLDIRYVYGDVETTYRDAMIGVAPTVNDNVTAGGASYAMQLYNTSRPVLAGYVYGMTQEAYEAAVVRFFAEGRAVAMFAYADGDAPDRWIPLGFRLVETYDIRLPRDRIMGRYAFDDPVAP